ncbi:hypothetical protein G7046_g6973 [Stylonectria norvegica]|nr:hypothetical protein G7046_g6973 [Stylonectria norvegica]
MPSTSKYATFEVPEVDLWTFMFERKDKGFRDEQVIYVDSETNRSYTYAQVKTVAIKFGQGLRDMWAWRKGDVLALFTPNSIDTPAIMWGCHWAGGVISPANPLYTVKELAFQLKDSGARAIVTHKDYFAVALQAADIAGIDKDKVILLGEERDLTGPSKHFTSISSLAASKQKKVAVNSDTDLAFLVYSSGTTGLPKGVMLTHRNIASNILMITAGEGGNLKNSGGHDGQGDKCLGFLPFFHIYGLTCLIHKALYTGVQLVVMAKFDLERFCQVIEKHKITFIYLVPPTILTLTKHHIVDKYDLSSVKMVSSGAAPLTRELVQGLHKRLGFKVKQGYGLSETSPTTHLQPWEEWDKSIGSVGKLLPNQTTKFMSPDEKEVPAGQVGELWIKGPNVFKGYWKNEESTRNALTEDGFFKTGDVGYEDGNGNFYITERIKELIKYKGFQVAPAELEGTLIDHPDIEDVGVIGIYDKEQATEVPRAYCVLRRGVKSHGKEQAISKWLASRVAHHKRLRGGVIFVEEIPKSTAGKILRRVLKDMARNDKTKAKL